MTEKKKSPAGAKPKQDNSKNTTTSIAETEVKGNPASKEKKDAKSREWWCVVYPDSAPSNWRELVQETFLEAYISPLHDKDKNPDGTPKKPHYHVVLAWSGPTTFSNAKNIMGEFKGVIQPKVIGSLRGVCRGTPKKPHYHVVLAWSGPTTFSNAKNIMGEFKGVIQPKVIGSLRGVCRYLCHLDNPEKAQYSPEDVICYNGADWNTVINLKSEKYTAIEEMQAFCDKYRITSFLILNTYARAHRKADWFRTLCDNGSYIMREYCKSMEWELQNSGSAPSIEDIDAMIEAIDAEDEAEPTEAKKEEPKEKEGKG